MISADQARVNALARERQRLHDEATRLAQRAARPDADARLAHLSERYRRRAAALEGELGALRTRLAREEAETETRRAAAAGA